MEAAARTQQEQVESCRYPELTPVAWRCLTGSAAFFCINKVLAATNGRKPGTEQQLGIQVQGITPQLAPGIEAKIDQDLCVRRTDLGSRNSWRNSVRIPGRERVWVTSFYPIKSANGVTP